MTALVSGPNWASQWRTTDMKDPSDARLAARTTE
jgi:hypothetical protein